MRVSMSAIGSVILIRVLLDSPARLRETRNLAAHHRLAQLRAREPELPVVAVRTARERAAIAQPNRMRVARQLLERGLGRRLAVVRRLRVADQLLELGPPLRVLLH